MRNGLPEIDSVIFDLDGTLWDTCEAVATGWNNVMERHLLPCRRVTAADVRGVIGKPHDLCVREVCVGLTEDELRILSAESEEEDNRVIAERGGVLYPGVTDGLSALADRHPLFIVSNCQAGYIEIFLRFHGFGPLFRDFECHGNTGRTKAENLRAVIDRNNLKAPIFVGDTTGDEAAALVNGIPFAFVSYGYGRCTKMQLTAGSFEQLRDFLLP
jgi:phosphoglycolate phosphatase